MRKGERVNVRGGRRGEYAKKREKTEGILLKKSPRGAVGIG
jgi:hypothetical protein